MTISRLERVSVSEAVAARISVRAFLDTPISDELIREVLTKAARAPSGGNLQPWRVYVLNGDTTTRFKLLMRAKVDAAETETPEYNVYPKPLKSPYRDSRYKIGEDMYELLEIPRTDKAARLRRLAENYQFFDAPAALFCFIDREMGRPQWSDLGMFLQTAMLLFQEAGVDTCAQEAWARWPQTVTGFVGAPAELMLFSGLAIGHRDPKNAVNDLYADREPLENFATFVK
jgi:nitroreductase